MKSVVRALRDAGPRIVRFHLGERPIVIFTDGACEERMTSVGGIIFEEGRRPQAFGVKMAEWTIREWATKEDQTQVICQAEIFPTLIARHTWAERLEGRRVIYFVNNDSARMALIKSYSPVFRAADVAKL